MQISVTYYGQVRQVTGKETEKLEASKEATVDDIIRLLVKQHGDKLARLLLDENGAHSRSILLALNNEVVVDPRNAVIIKENDELSILPAISGG